MSEPEKQPEMVEPTTGKTDDIKPANDVVQADKTVTPAAANTNNKTAETVPSITPVVDVAPKKEPVVSIPVPPVTAPVEAPVSNDNKTIAPEAKTEAAPVAAPEAAPEAAPAAPVATAETTPAPAAPGRTKGFLKKAFNFAVKMGVGAAVSATLKTAAVVGAGIAGAPAWATILISGVAVGIGATLVHDFYERKELKKQGVELAPYFSKAHGKQFVSKKGLKTFGISTVAAVAGSMLFMGFHEGIIQNWWNHLTGHAPAAVIPPVAPAVVAPLVPQHVVVAPPAVEHVVAPVAPVVVPCPTPMQQFTTLVGGHHVSAQVENAIHRAASVNPRIHAQGLKDLAYYSQNGFGGVPKDHTVALNLFKQAADLGNVQGKVDMVYLQHYGLDGIHADKAVSTSMMKGLAQHSHRAAEFTKAWGATGATPTDFNSGTIVQGVKAICPAI